MPYEGALADLPIYSLTSADSGMAQRNYDPINSVKTDQAQTAVTSIRTAVTLRDLRKVSNWQDNWDGNGSAAPDRAAVSLATGSVEEFYRAALSVSRHWVPPKVSASEEGDVVFEWWRARKKVTLYFSGTKIQYLKVWGPDIRHDMVDGDLSRLGFPELWHWLVSDR